ncbi:MAG: M24 family metallopeptidase, partial [Clostridiales bacterium]|nr:M24 family metallopeptidase [Clostridiales bacterium]
VKVNDTEEERFLKEGVAVKPYMSIEASLSALSSGVLVADKNRVSRSLIHALPPDVILLNKRDYPYLMKAVLNDVELASQFKAGIRDSVAVSRYLYYVKHVAVKEGLNEIEVAEKLRELRQESDQFIIESFPTISAYGKNAAMMHYQATPEQYSQLQPRGLYLVDCGAQSYDGTTDITRTVSLGALTEEERRDYTETLKSHIQLASLPFLDGTSGVALDAVARSSMWRYGLDYKCGTGHGFGFVSGVHEGPQRLTHVPRFGDYGFREHIVITIEPGVYREGKHGIRLENDYIVLKINCEAVIDKGEIHFEENEYPLNEAGDQFLRFQTMTFVPFDRDAIDKNRLSPDELAWLNDYHEAVRALILPFLEGDEYDFVYRETERL